jgi:hypothetical protein
MNHETRRAIALWRMSVLGPLVSMDLEHGDLRPLLEAAATRTYETPQGRRVRPRWRTLEAWYYAHKHGGLEALEPATRKDTGTCRALPERAGAAHPGAAPRAAAPQRPHPRPRRRAGRDVPRRRDLGLERAAAATRTRPVAATQRQPGA